MIYLVEFNDDDDERYLIEGVNETDARDIVNCEFGEDEFTIEEIIFEGGIYELLLH